MRIGIDARPLQDHRYSGVSSYACNLLNEILKKDKTNDYIFFYNSFRNPQVPLPFCDRENVKIAKYSLPNKFLNYAGFSLLNRPLLDRSLAVDFFFMPHINHIALQRYDRLVLTIHDLSFMRNPEYFSARKNIWHKMIGVKSLIRKSARVVAVSENTKRDIIELCDVDEGKVEVIYSGLNFSADDVRRVEIGNSTRDKYGLVRPYIFFLGNIEPRKNIVSIIKAYERMCIDKNFECDLVLAGESGWKCANIYETVKYSPSSDRIRFLGYVSESERIELYKNAVMLIFPSFYEGFGFPPLEAMACGTPVITSNISSLPEITGSSAILVNPHDIGDIYQAMKMLIDDESLREDYKRRGKERAKNFMWSKAAEAYLEIFMSFI